MEDKDITQLIQLLQMIKKMKDTLDKFDVDQAENNTQENMPSVCDILNAFNKEHTCEDETEGNIIDYMLEFDTREILVALAGAFCLSGIISAEDIASCLDDLDSED